MTDCPALADLEIDPTSQIRDHLAACTSCRIVVELLEERRRGRDERDRQDECARFEMLIAAREEGSIGGTAGELLAGHLRQCADCAAVAATLLPAGDRAAHSALPAVSTASYALGREVARGGMGRIVEALDIRIGRPVAVKELLGKAPSLAARFEREARVTARLQHPGIVPIYEIGKWPDGTPFYAMRMVEGTTLREAITGKQALDERLALLPALIAAAEAVAFAHGKRIIHRDLTPSNILVGSYGDTVVIDWGLAKDLSDPSDEPVVGPYRDEPGPGANLTSAGAVIGTAAYMPPEQASGASVDTRADVYALGAILYHVLAGTAPYRASASDEIVRQVKAGPPRDIDAVAAGAPRDLVSIVEKAMAREPSDRYATAGELADELRRFQTGRVVEAHHYSRGERVRRWLLAHRTSVLAGVAAVVALAIAGTIGLAGIVRERDRAELARSKTETQNLQLMEEQGRQELIAGNTTRALAWLNEAYKAGDASPELRFMLGTAMQRIESIVHTAECAGKVHSIEFSPDGKHVLAACEFGIGIARTSDWAIETTIAAHINGAVYSHDGKLIASKEYKRVSLWDAATGSLVRGPIEVGDQVRTTAFTPDDRTLVTASDDAKVRVIDVATGRVLHEMDARSGKMNVVRVDITPDGKTIVSMTSDGVYQEWDVASGAHLRTFKIPAQPIAGDSMISPDGSRVISCTADGSIWITELATGRLISTFAAHENVAFDCQYSRDGREILTSGLDGTARVWDAASGRLVSTLHHGGLWIRAKLSPDGERVATLGNGGGLKLWHAASGTLLASMDDPFGIDEQLVFSPDGHVLISARMPSTIVVMKDFDAGMRSIPLPAGTSAEGASPDLQRLVFQHAGDGSLTIVDAASLAPLPHEAIRAPFAFSRDATRFVASGRDGVVIIDLQTGRTVAKLAVPRPDMLALDDRGRRVLVAGAKSSVWDVASGKLVLELGKQSDKDCLSPGGDLVLAWQDPTSVEVWNIDARRVQVTIRLERETLGPLGYDATGTRVILGEKDDPLGQSGWPMTRLALYDTATGAKLADFGRSIFTTLDGARRFVVLSAFDYKLAIRDASDGRLVAEIAATGAVSAGQAMLDGEFVVAQDLSTMGIHSANDGRLLASMRPIPTFTLDQDSFQANNPDVTIRRDGRSLVQLGRHPVQWTLPREERSPEEVDRIVRERVRWRVVNGQLLPVTAALHGRVLRHGQPVARAEIAIAIERYGSFGIHALTDGEGRFAVQSLPYGSYTIIAMAPDHSAKGIHRMDIARDDISADLELDEEATISGVVVDERGQPVSGVQVKQGELAATSDASGQFTITAIGAGNVELGVVEARDGKPTGFVHVGEPRVKVNVRSNADRVTGVKLVVRRAP